MATDPTAALAAPGPRPQHATPVQFSDLVGSANVPGSPSVLVTGITADSRLVRPGDLYVAAQGATHHGADFAAEAVARGAVAVLTDAAGAGRTDLPTVPLAVAAEPRGLVGGLAARLYGHPAEAVTMYGLTGTNGKTTTAYLLTAALRSAGRRTGLVGTLGFTLDGEPLPGPRTTVTTPEAAELQALLAVMVDGGADAVVMEVSSHALALGRTDGIRFDVAGFTNLGRDHLDFHGDLESYFEAKARLFTPAYARTAVLDVDDPRGAELADRVRREGGLALVRVSLSDPTADFGLVSADPRPGGWDLVARTPAGPVRAELALPGRYNVRNALLALAMAASAGVAVEAAAAGLAGAAVPGRMQRVPLEAGAPTVVVDFAHTPQAVAAVLAALADGARRRVVVLGAGGDRDRAKRLPMGAAATAADLVVVTDDNPRTEDPAAIRGQLLAGAREGAAAAEVVDGGDRRAAIAYALAHAGPDDVVAVLGKGHETGQEVGGQVLPFDDAAVVAEVWRELHPEPAA